MPASEDLIPAYLAQLLASNSEGQVGPNTPFLGFGTAEDGVTLEDAVTTNAHTGSAVYGTRIYGAFAYGHS